MSDEADQVFGADASLASAGGLGGNDDFQVDDGGFDDADGNDYDGGGDDDGYQDEAQQDALDVDQAIGLAPDEDDEEQMPRTTTSKGKAKGKGRGKANVLSDKTNKRRVATTGSESEAERPVQKRARTARAMSVEQTAIRRRECIEKRGWTLLTRPVFQPPTKKTPIRTFAPSANVASRSSTGGERGPF